MPTCCLPLAIALLASDPKPALPTPAQIDENVKKFLTTSDYRTVRNFPAQDLPDEAVPVKVQYAERLVRSVASVTKPGLGGPKPNVLPLMIPYRVTTGDLKSIGHGLFTFQDLYIEGGRAAWALEGLLGVDLPEINEGLAQDERARRAAEVGRHVAAFKRLPAFFAATDYPTLARTARDWRALPVGERVALLAVLVPHIEDATEVGLKNYCALNIPGRPDSEPPRPPEPGQIIEGFVHDIFLVGGRAAWAIDRLVEPDAYLQLPAVKKDLTQEERAAARAAYKVLVTGYKAGARDGAGRPAGGK